MAFETSADFAKTMGYLHAIGLEEAKAKITKLNSFKSLALITPHDRDDIERLNKAYWQRSGQLMADDYDPSIDDVAPPETLEYDDYLIQDPYLEIVLNTHREIVIGDYFIRATEDGVFAYTIAQKANFEAQFGTDFFEKALRNHYTREDITEARQLDQITNGVYLVNRDVELFNQPGMQQWCTS